MSQNCYTTPPLLLDDEFGHCHMKGYITEIVLESFLGAIILAGDFSDFRKVISGNLGFWEKSSLAS